MIKNRFSAVIFDLDGTLLETLSDLAGAMNQILGKHGFPLHETGVYRKFIGNGVEQLVRRSIPENTPEDLVPALVREMKLAYGKGWAVKTRPYDGIPELLKELTDRNTALAVLSNKPDEFTKKMTTHFFPGIPFAAVFGARNGIPLKPDPASALEICRITGKKPDDFIYLGDSGTDMQTANRAGMYPVGVLWGFRDDKELRENGAKMLIKRPDEILGLF